MENRETNGLNYPDRGKIGKTHACIDGIKPRIAGRNLHDEQSELRSIRTNRVTQKGVNQTESYSRPDLHLQAGRVNSPGLIPKML